MCFLSGGEGFEVRIYGSGKRRGEAANGERNKRNKTVSLRCEEILHETLLS